MNIVLFKFTPLPHRMVWIQYLRESDLNHISACVILDKLFNFWVKLSITSCHFLSENPTWWPIPFRLKSKSCICRPSKLRPLLPLGLGPWARWGSSPPTPCCSPNEALSSGLSTRPSLLGKQSYLDIPTFHCLIILNYVQYYTTQNIVLSVHFPFPYFIF